MPRWLFAAAGSLALLSSSIAASQAPEPSRDAALAEAGIRFPERLGRFQQVLDEPGGDRFTARYQLSRDDPRPGLIDVFVTRAEISPEQELALTEPLISQLFPNLVLIRELSAPPGVNGAAGRLWSGDYQGSRIVTALLVWHQNGWRVKIRATMLAAEGEGDCQTSNGQSAR